MFFLFIYFTFINFKGLIQMIRYNPDTNQDELTQIIKRRLTKREIRSYILLTALMGFLFGISFTKVLLN